MLIVGDEVYKAKAFDKVEARRASLAAGHAGASDTCQLQQHPSGSATSWRTRRVSGVSNRAGCRHQYRQQAAAQLGNAHRLASHGVHRHAQRRGEHWQRDDDGGAARRGRRLWHRGSARSGQRFADSGAEDANGRTRCGDSRVHYAARQLRGSFQRIPTGTAALSRRTA